MRIVLFSILFLLSSCSTNQQNIKIYKSIPCAALKPISYSSKNDTQITKDQIKEFNAVYQKLCEY